MMDLILACVAICIVTFVVSFTWYCIFTIAKRSDEDGEN